MERIVGDVFIDDLDGMKVIVVGAVRDDGCKNCAFATRAGGACPGVVYDRHPCMAGDRSDGRDVFFQLIHVVPEKKAPPLVFKPFGSIKPFKDNSL